MTFEAWSGLVEEKKEQQRMARKALSLFLNKGLAMCYHAWQGWARQERQRKIDEGKAMAMSQVLEEEIDENYEPTEAEIVEYATWLGMVRASPPLLGGAGGSRA